MAILLWLSRETMEREQNLRVDTMAQGDRLIVSIFGHIGIENASKMQSQLDEIIPRAEKNILINCAGMTFVSSSGLRAFLKFAKEASSAQKKLSFFSLPEDVGKVFEIAGLTKVFDIYPNQQTALNALA